jgi:hypothetical protein
MSRRARPSFGHTIRCEETPKKIGGSRSSCEPLVKPADQTGVLWDAFRGQSIYFG